MDLGLTKKSDGLSRIMDNNKLYPKILRTEQRIWFDPKLYDN